MFSLTLGALCDGEFSEKDWPENMEKLEPYPRSKAMAEKAAWDFVNELKGTVFVIDNLCNRQGS